MKRRTLLGLGATLGGAAMIGTNAFSSVRAERSIEVEVVGDQNALLALEPCDTEDEDEDDEVGSSDETGNDGSEEAPKASEFVYETSDGTIVIDLTAIEDDEEDEREGITGDGITRDSLWRFPNAFRITNQGTQNVAVDLKLEDDNGEVPTVDEKEDINGEDIEEGDPAVVFYKGSDSDKQFSSDELNPDAEGADHLEPGDSVCVGFDVRTFGLEGDDLRGLTLRIRAGERDEIEPPVDGDLRNDLVFGKPNGKSQRIRKLSGGKNEVTNPTGSEGNLKALGPPAYPSDGDLVAPFLKDKNKIETTDGERFKLNPDWRATDEPTLLAVGEFDGSPASIFYAGEEGKIYRVPGDDDENPVSVSDDTDAKAVAGIGDIDGDGSNELVFVDEGEKVKYLTEGGDVENTEISIGSTNSIGQPAAFGDDIKIPIVNGDDEIKLIEYDEDSDFQTEPVTGADDAAQAPLTAIDLDGDGDLEIVYVGTSGKLKFIDNPLSDPKIETIEDDNDEEIHASSNTGVA